jgi:hypothetical protein
MRKDGEVKSEDNVCPDANYWRVLPFNTEFNVLNNMFPERLSLFSYLNKSRKKNLWVVGRRRRSWPNRWEPSMTQDISTY